ncbi:hypothetical protein [Endothiovibrio diazotrophicus]
MRTPTLLLLLTALAAAPVLHAEPPDAPPDGGRGPRGGPPPEAFGACEGKSAGDSAEFTDRRGETRQGTCEESPDGLVLRPAGGAGGGPGGGPQSGDRRGPPPEAYTACEGKSAGERAEMNTPRGDTMQGTCEESPEGLVLRPERNRRRPPADEANR